MDRSNHYEAAFEAYLQAQRLCYVAVDETRRSLIDEEPVKSLDFIVHGETVRLLIDIKGRRFPTGSPQRRRRIWECWSTEEDITGLGRWQERFGPGYRGVLVFAYLLGDDVTVPDDTDDLWRWRGRRYLFRAVPADAYRQAMRVRSPRWKTVSLPGPVFRRLVRPISHFTQKSDQRSAFSDQQVLTGASP
jgi:hypothetical protein